MAQQDDQERQERQPLLRSLSSRHGTTAPRGESDLIQTVFNSTNVLLGVGLLSLPLAIKYAGWIIGILLLVSTAAVTAYTAKVLGRCLDSDKSLATYADLAYASYGPSACYATRILFSLIMMAVCIALTILFGDIMHSLIPSLTGLQWKLVCGLVLIPLQFLPFSLLSIASAVGVGASFALVLLTILAGLLKDHALGSLREPAPTSLYPESWAHVLLSVGLFMAPWGGHASFPNLYRDMRDPMQYNRALGLSFSSAFVVDFTMAICGYLMYGRETMDEVLANILSTPGHPRALLITIVVIVAIMPVTKIPLISRPLVMMVESIALLDSSTSPPSVHLRDSSGRSTLTLHTIRTTLRILIVALITVLAIICPNFDVVMAFAGSALCLTICVVLPLLFYVKLFEGRLSPVERIIDWTLIVVATALAVFGTVIALVPKSGLPGALL